MDFYTHHARSGPQPQPHKNEREKRETTEATSYSLENGSKQQDTNGKQLPGSIMHLAQRVSRIELHAAFIGNTLHHTFVR